jgi:hypothetical protein
MRTLMLSPLLKQEFATVESLWHSNAETRRVDSLILSWVKYEKQLRRLFCFLVFQQESITEEIVDEVITILAQNQKLYPETFIAGIKELGVPSVAQLLGPRYEELQDEISTVAM